MLNTAMVTGWGGTVRSTGAMVRRRGPRVQGRGGGRALMRLAPRSRKKTTAAEKVVSPLHCMVSH